MSYAVIQTGGKQYRVAPGQSLKVETIAGDEGAEISIKEVLLVADGDSIRVGKPLLEGAQVRAKIVKHGRTTKVHIIKFKRRKTYKRQAGHRQNFTEIQILAIQ
jgi:large subunit ribosomal protein L21